MLYQCEKHKGHPAPGFGLGRIDQASSTPTPTARFPLSDGQSGVLGLELLHRLGKEYEKPEFGHKSTRIGLSGRDRRRTDQITKPFPADCSSSSACCPRRWPIAPMIPPC